MNHALQALLIIVIAGLGICLALLILQLTRTARAVQALAESAREDLRSITQDIHGVRLQADKLAELAERSLAFPANASEMAATLVRTLTSALTLGRSPLWDGLVTVLKIGLDFFRRPRRAAATQEANHE